MPYIHFTDEQKRQANEVNLAEFLRLKGEPLIRSGRELRMERNHSVTVWGNEWYDHAMERGGGPVSFLKEFYGMNYQEAVLTLLDQDVSLLCSQVDTPREKERKPFVRHQPTPTTDGCSLTCSSTATWTATWSPPSSGWASSTRTRVTTTLSS